MGTGAVYVTLSGIKYHSPVLTHIETAFYFLNMALFIINTTTLLLQALRESIYASLQRGHSSQFMHIVYPRQAKRLITDPTKGIFVPLIVCAILHFSNVR